MRRILLLAALITLAFVGRAQADVSLVNPYFSTSHASCTVSPCSRTLPTTAAAGNLLVAWVATLNLSGCANLGATTGPDVPPTGWNIAGTPICGSTRNNGWWLWKVATGNDSLAVQIAFTSGTQYVNQIVYELTGANNSAPIDGVAYAAITTTLVSPVVAADPGLTTHNGDFLISGFLNPSVVSTGVSCVSPCTGSWTQVMPYATAFSPNAVTMSKAQPLAGAFGPPGFTFTGTSSNALTGSIAIAAPSAVVNPFYTVPKLHAGGKGVGTPLALWTPPPPPVGGTPPPLDTMAWWNGNAGTFDNKTTTVTQTQQLLDYCNGVGSTTGGAEITANCEHAYVYMDAHAPYVDTNGFTTSLPFHISQLQTALHACVAGVGCCPASVTTSTGFWKQSSPAFNFTDTNVENNWGKYAVGSTVGSNTLGVATDKGDYVPFLNIASPSLISFTNQVYQNCQFVGGAHVSHSTGDLYEGFFEDNWYNNGMYIWGVSFYAGLDKQKSFGISSGSPYVSWSACNGGYAAGATFFNNSGILCTMTSQYTTNNSVQGTYGSTPAATDTAMANFFASIKHYNGTPFKFIYNGLGAPNPIIQTGAGVTGGAMENYALGSGCSPSTVMPTGTAPNYTLGCSGVDANISQIIDNCAAIASDFPTTRAFLLQDFPSTSAASGQGAPLGSAAHQWAQRYMAGIDYLCAHDTLYGLLVGWMELEQGSVDANQTSTWAWQYARPWGRGQPYPARPVGAGNTFPCGEPIDNNYGTGCPVTAGGAFDPNLCASGTPPDCIVRVSWSHYYYQPTPDLTSWPSSWNYTGGNTVSDLGHFGMIWNRTSSAITLSSTNLAAWLPDYALYTKVVLLCTPLTGAGGYLNTTGAGSVYNVANGQAIVCSSTTGHDASNGGTLDHSTLKGGILNETLPKNDVIFFSEN